LFDLPFCPKKTGVKDGTNGSTEILNV
jgi:hypothetical protein